MSLARTYTHTSTQTDESENDEIWLKLVRFALGVFAAAMSKPLEDAAVEAMLRVCGEELATRAQETLGPASTEEERQAWVAHVALSRFWALTEEEQDEIHPDATSLREAQQAQKDNVELEAMQSLQGGGAKRGLKRKHYTLASDITQLLQDGCDGTAEIAAVLTRVRRGMEKDVPTLTQTASGCL